MFVCYVVCVCVCVCVCENNVKMRPGRMKKIYRRCVGSDDGGDAEARDRGSPLRHPAHPQGGRRNAVRQGPCEGEQDHPQLTRLFCGLRRYWSSAKHNRHPMCFLCTALSPKRTKLCFVHVWSADLFIVQDSAPGRNLIGMQYFETWQ